MDELLGDRVTVPQKCVPFTGINNVVTDHWAKPRNENQSYELIYDSVTLLESAHP